MLGSNAAVDVPDSRLSSRHDSVVASLRASNSTATAASVAFFVMQGPRELLAKARNSSWCFQGIAVDVVAFSGDFF